VVAAVAPIVQDEAYYLAWATAPDWGYFDHPPGVAWVAATGLLSWGSPLAGRLGALAVAALAFPFAAGLLVRAGITDREAHLAGLLLLTFNFCALAAGALTTPDAAFVTAWSAALHEAATALAGRRTRWIGAGLAAGLGLLAKYNMVLIGPVFAWALWRGDRNALRTPWPWLGAIVAGVVFAPHLAWNAQHEWVPIRFQLHRGFGEPFRQPAGLATRLPSAEVPGEPERAIGRWFKPWQSGSAALLKEPPRHGWPRRGDRISGYVLAVVAVWGALLVPIAQLALARLRRLPRAPDPVDPRVRPLLVAAAAVPAGFFGLACLATRVEANWPAVYVLGAAPLLAAFCARRLRATVVQATINATLLLAVALYARVPLGAHARDRLVRETQGYPELAELLATRLQGRPVFGDTHQLIAELNFHAPHLAVRQWPGVTRPSEYLRRAEWNRDTIESLQSAGEFWLVIDGLIPPRLPGFRPAQAFVAYFCLGQGLVAIDAFSTAEFAPPCPGRTVHRWLAVRYAPEPPGS
jgi:4-amino-4-deoxy-L-arabinose transferase-like glycosyltransferase